VGLAVSTSVLLASGTVATGLPAWLITVFIVLLFGGLWFAFPLARRHR
jgi:cbb3-type cytochrome oxidase subunit 3